MHVRLLSLPGLEASSRRLSPCCGWESACQTYLPGMIVELATQETILNYHCASYKLQQLVSAVRQDMNGGDLSDQGKALVIISKHGRDRLCPLSKYNVMIRSPCRCIFQMCGTAQKLQGQECQNRPRDSNCPPVLDAAGQKGRALWKRKEGKVIRNVPSMLCFELRQLHVGHRLASSAAHVMLRTHVLRG